MRNILYIAGPEDGGDAKPKTKAELQADLDAANARIVELEKKNAIDEAFEKKVRERIGKGLSRKQAEAAVRQQDTFDASEYGRMKAALHAKRQAKALADKEAKLKES